jgi:hypothetical protein
MSEVKEHSVIYLSPSDDPEREWCQDDVWEESVRYNLGTDFDRVTAERDALQVLLTAADERADVLSPGSALGDVHLERLRQIDVENRSPVDDDDYSLGQIAYAAAGYAQGSVPAQQVQGCLRPSYWPWHPRWWKPGSPRRMLVKAGALILAEIERIDRAALKPAEGGGDE